MLADDVNIFPVVFHTLRLAFSFDKEIKLTWGLSAGEVASTTACVVETSRVSQKLVLKTKQPLVYSILQRRVGKVGLSPVDMPALYGIVYVLASLGPHLSLKIFLEESPNTAVYTLHNFLKYRCSQQLFSLLIALLRGGGMRDGRAIKRGNDARGRS